jgi:hypothetical protein
MIYERSPLFFLGKCCRTLTSLNGTIRERLIEVAPLLASIRANDVPYDLQTPFHEVLRKLNLETEGEEVVLDPSFTAECAVSLLKEYEVLRVTYLIIGLAAEVEKEPAGTRRQFVSAR